MSSQFIQGISFVVMLQLGWTVPHGVSWTEGTLRAILMRETEAKKSGKLDK